MEFNENRFASGHNLHVRTQYRDCYQILPCWHVNGIQMNMQSLKDVDQALPAPWYILCNTIAMSHEPIDIALDFDSIHYTGWATPSDKYHEDGWPKSFHVVLNETFFGNVSFDNGKWLLDEQRPDGMVDVVGAAIKSKYDPATSVKS